MNSFEKFQKEAPKNYWLEIVKKLMMKEKDKLLDPIEIRAALLIEALGLPSGPYSALERPKTKETKERDRIITEYLTRNTVWIDKKEGVVSCDFRDIYPEGLPQELKTVLDKDFLEIVEIEYKHQKEAEKQYEKTKNKFWLDCPIYYCRLPGGIDLFMKGYRHHPQWQKLHGFFLKEINKLAKVICLEGFIDCPFGESLRKYWNDPFSQEGVYDKLMKDAVRAGFKGLFTEIDARDTSSITMDHKWISKSYRFSIFPSLSFSFYKYYFEYLQRENPKLTKDIGTPGNLEEILKAHSTSEEGIEKRTKIIFKRGKIYSFYPYLTKEGKISFEPTYFELGQHLFSDALAVIKLHLIAKLMADGYIEKGPIIEYEGVNHLSNKRFFIEYPQYAMEVVLRTINELMAGKVKTFPEIYEVFTNPDWSEIVREITRLCFKKPESHPLKSIEIGPNQRKLEEIDLNFLNIYGIDPKKIIPSDEEIKKIREKI